MALYPLLRPFAFALDPEAGTVRFGDGVRNRMMAGVNVPLQPVKHQYVVTEKIPGLAADAATIRDPDLLTYFKEEVGGLVMGGYEPNPKLWRDGSLPGLSAVAVLSETAVAVVLINERPWRWRPHNEALAMLGNAVIRRIKHPPRQANLITFVAKGFD